MTMTADDYIRNVLDAMPAATPRRAQIAAELRGHIAERLESEVHFGSGTRHQSSHFKRAQLQRISQARERKRGACAHT